MALLAALGAWELGHGAWIHAKAQLAQYLLQRAWARTLRGEPASKPWPWADTWPVARLRVPAHGVDLIVLTGVSGRTLAFGPGHAPQSAAPGEPGTAIVTAHRDTHFRFLERLQRGDEILVDVPGRPSGRFRVDELSVVDSRSAVIRTEPGVSRARADDLLSVRRARGRRSAALRGHRACVGPTRSAVRRTAVI